MSETYYIMELDKYSVWRYLTSSQVADSPEDAIRSYYDGHTDLDGKYVIAFPIATAVKMQYKEPKTDYWLKRNL